jgi:hypothetical protein
MSHVARREAIAVAAETARLEIQAEVEKARHGRSSLDSLANLAFIEARLRDIAGMLRAGTVLRDQSLVGSMGRLIVDTWPLRHPLGEQVAKVEYEFERL